MIPPRHTTVLTKNCQFRLLVSWVSSDEVSSLPSLKICNRSKEKKKETIYDFHKGIFEINENFSVMISQFKVRPNQGGQWDTNIPNFFPIRYQNTSRL